MRVLAYTSPARGHLFPLIPILGELRDRGHDVSARTLAGSVDLVRSLGVGADAIDPRIEAIEHDDFLAKSPVGAIKRSTATFAKRSGYEPDDLRSAIAVHGPELLLIDTNCWGAAAVAEASGLPWASWLPYPAPFPGKGIPPFGPGLAPARGWTGRLRDAVLDRLIAAGVEGVVTTPLNAIRASIGVPALSNTRELFARPPLTLYLTAEPFDYHRVEWPSSFRFVGPLAFDPSAEPPPWLDEIDKPIIVVTTSSEFQNDVRLVSNALEAMKDEDVFVVATLPAGDPARIDVPANAWVERWLPHSALMPRAVCVITHAGMGATQKRWLMAFPSSQCPSAAISWRSRGGSRSVAPEFACLPSGSLPRVCERPSARRERAAIRHVNSHSRSTRPAAHHVPRTRSNISRRHGKRVRTQTHDASPHHLPHRRTHLRCARAGPTRSRRPRRLSDGAHPQSSAGPGDSPGPAHGARREYRRGCERGMMQRMANKVSLSGRMANTMTRFTPGAAKWFSRRQAAAYEKSAGKSAAKLNGKPIFRLTVVGGSPANVAR